jgi:hypothetical protein
VDIVPIADLTWDFDLYPRQAIDTYHVARLAAKLDAGADLPPVTACRATRKIIDGFHRGRAHQRLGRTKIAVDWRDYPDDQARLLGAVAANSGHGRTLTAWDEARCVLLAERLGIPAARLAGAMQVRTEAIARVRDIKIARDHQARPVAIKATVRHLAGRTMTERQQEGAARVGGMSGLFYVNQVINLAEHDLLDLDDPRVVSRLGDLHAALHRVTGETEAS